MTVAIPNRIVTGNKPSADLWMDDIDWLTAMLGGNRLLNAGLETWEQGTSFSSPADGTLICNAWTLNKGGTLAPTFTVSREATYIDSGIYSAEVDVTVAGSANSYIKIKQSIADYTKFAGTTIVAGMKIKTGTATKVRISVYDGTTTAYSDYHTGGGTFEQLYASMAVAAVPTELTIKIEISPSDFVDVIYFDSAYLYTVPSQISTKAKAALGFVTTDDISQADALSAVTDGWTSANETWTYASATTFTISGDKTSKYQVGDKIRLTQTTVKYFYITVISYSAGTGLTTMTVSATVGGTAYSVANAAITAPYFSKMETPQAFGLLRTMTKEDAVTSLITGWVPVKDTWAYASASTITVPSGAASIYQVGDKIQLTQTTVKYFYIIGVADTVLTVTGGSDYTVANAAISAISFSKASNPQGFPQWFNYTPTLNTGTADLSAFNVAKFYILGRTLFWHFYCVSRSMSGSAGSCKISLPVTGVNGRVLLDYHLYSTGTGNVLATMIFVSSDGVAELYASNAMGNFTGSDANVEISINLSYQI